MPVKFKCPECGGILSVPKKFVGAQINCPHNGCLVEVPQHLLAKESARSDSTRGGADRKTADSAPESGREAGKHRTNGTHAAADPVPKIETQPAARPAKPSRWRTSKVARFLTPEAKSGVEPLAADGKLPALSLAEDDPQKRPEEQKSTNPALLVTLLSLSFGLSALMLMMDFGPQETGRVRREQARQHLSEFYAQPDESLVPYQVYLREAQRAHSRGDRAAERESYRRVLRLLRAEGRSRFETVTRTPAGDDRLEELLSILLSED
jgi:hypothetical protein